MRQLAWLHCAPDDQKRNKERKSRAQMGFAANLPELDESVEHLREYIAALGYAEPGANGPIVIKWGEIAAWAQLTGVDLLPVEAEILHDLSRQYVVQYHQSKDFNCPPPAAPAKPQATAEKIATWRNRLKSAANRGKGASTNG